MGEGFPQKDNDDRKNKWIDETSVGYVSSLGKSTSTVDDNVSFAI